MPPRSKNWEEEKPHYEGPVEKLVAAVFAVLLLFATAAFAEENSPAIPKVTVSTAEGYLVLFKDGITPGSASTRFGLGLSWVVAPKTSVSVTFGINTSNTEFKPLPRVILGVGYALTDRVSAVVGLLYQFCYGYGGKPHNHLFGGSLGVRLKVGNGFSLGFDAGPAKTIEAGSWSFLFQPSVSYTF